MKTKLITSLKSRVCLIDDYKDEHDAYYYMSDCPILKKYRCIGKLKDLTDEQIKNADIVETKPYGSPPYFCTIYYPWKGKNKDGFNPGLCVDNGNQFKESFLSALEAEGLHLNGNPYKQQFDKYFHIKHFEKSEQNVFSPETLVFVEQ